MMIKKIIIPIVFILAFQLTHSQKKVIENNSNYQYQSNNTNAQTTQTYTKKTNYFERKWSFGGNVGFSFWNDGTDILVAPKAYYHVSPHFIAGAGLTYAYSDFKNNRYKYKSNAFGGSILGLYRPIPYLQFSAEFEELYINRDYQSRDGFNPSWDDSYWNSALYLGASFVSGNFAFGINYDILYDDIKSPYSSPWTPVISFYF